MDLRRFPRSCLRRRPATGRRPAEIRDCERREWVFECRIEDADGGDRWISAAGRPLLGADGKVAKLIGYVIDISETKRNEAQLSLLTQELNHRVRNMLAMIQSMVRLSAAKASDISAFARGLEGRVSALARSHEMFVGEADVQAVPSAILKRELAGFPEALERTRVDVISEVALPGPAGQGLGLVLHELIANAMGKQGRATLAFPPEGLRCRMEIDLAA